MLKIYSYDILWHVIFSTKHWAILPFSPYQMNISYAFARRNGAFWLCFIARVCVCVLFPKPIPPNINCMYDWHIKTNNIKKNAYTGYTHYTFTVRTSPKKNADERTSRVARGFRAIQHIYLYLYIFVSVCVWLYNDREL